MTVSVSSVISTYYAWFNNFSVYQGTFADPFYSTGATFYRYQHATQNRWIWVRTSDKAIVYEQFYDGTVNSYVKYFVGGIVANAYLFTSDFRISKCSNPFVALPKVDVELVSAFSIIAENATAEVPAEAVSLAGSKKKSDIE